MPSPEPNSTVSDFSKQQVSSWNIPFMCYNESLVEDLRLSRTDSISDRNWIPLIQAVMSSNGAEDPFGSSEPKTFE